MARKTQLVSIGKRSVELSNLDKVLYPEDGITKAEIIEYYLKIAPTILQHIKNRPLSMIRFPDGIHGEQFFQKNKQEWAPQWLESVSLGKESPKQYILPTEDATLVWLANMACLELHQMHCYKPHYDNPDYMVFDIDPPEGYKFTDVVHIALRLKEHVESFGYNTFPKTTGGKGIHIICPLEVRFTFDEVFEAAKAIAQPFVAANKETTLKLVKASRKGGVLIDVFRIRPHQTIVCPYSLRGRTGAPVSMPLRWEELEKCESPLEYHLRNVADKVLSEGDAWEGIGSYAVDLHTKRRKTVVKQLPKNPKHKTPDQLKEYEQKRQFGRTPEPLPAIAVGTGNAFVVNRHHARNLHYDLRLEQEGVLKSWAVPKGLPPYPGIKRLAVQTEDHPLEYINFDGVIPKGEYGAGKMWIYARGKYEITKEKKDGFYFRLKSPELNAEYRMYQTGNKQWLLERVDKPQIDWLHDRIEFMLANTRTDIPKSNDWVFEVKWDGIRVMVAVDEANVRLTSRNGHDLTKQFPELTIPECFRVASGLFDGEIVCLDAKGHPSFKNVIHRMQQSSEGGVKRAAAKFPAFCYVFDVLYCDGRALINEPLIKRREWLMDSVKSEQPYRVSEIVDEGEELFAAAGQLGLEGIMAKDIHGKYTPGKRGTAWYKIKVRNTTDVAIIGYTQGKGDRNAYFGALHIATYDDGDLKYRGKVGTGFDSRMMKEIYEMLKKVKKIKLPVPEKPLDDAVTTWIEPKLWCEIQYASITPNDTYREPVFIRMRPDLSI